MIIEFFIPGNPVAKGRARITTIGGKPRCFTPKVTENFEAKVATIARQHYTGEPLTGPLALSLVFNFQRPKSHYGSGKNAEFLKPAFRDAPVGKPDLDNLVKAVKDGLNGVIWRDDSQIQNYILPFGKRYDATPGVTVRVQTLEYVNRRGE